MTKTRIPDHITRLYIDTNVFIYLLEGKPRFAGPVAEIMAEADTRGITLVISEFAICECLVGAHRRSDPDLSKRGLQTVWRMAAMFNTIALVPLPNSLLCRPVALCKNPSRLIAALIFGVVVAWL